VGRRTAPLSRKLVAGPVLNLRESEVGEEVRHFLKRVGWRYYSLAQGRKTRQTPGLPDLWCLHPSGRPPFWVELKSETGTSSPAQLEFAALCHTAGTGHVVGGVTQVMDHLKKIGAL
jgi:hypothetical protein